MATSRKKYQDKKSKNEKKKIGQQNFKMDRIK